ncbi:MAG: precorrin-2 dehydrogenase/sirohydrochlorin ferrochelatase family protein [Gemmataceae bacterium]
MMLPLGWNLSGRFVLLVGAGGVGLRKLTILRAAGARLRVVDPRPIDRPTDDPHVEWCSRHFDPADLDGMALAIAAATPEVNAAVTAAARRARVPVANCSDPASGDFTFPARFGTAHIHGSIATTPSVPAVARMIAERLSSTLTEELDAYVAFVGELRHEILDGQPPGEERTELLRACGRWEHFELFRTQGAAAFRAMLLPSAET